ncbi:prephenate dehydrogenase/arogenate dehydrogenase family protein, partial [Patescibacteria group bacterium]
MSTKKLNIAIIGFGRFGKLLCEIFIPFGNIFIISRQQVRKRGVIQIDYPDLKKMDWIIPSVPISVYEKELKKINPHLKKGSLVVDVCSVKVLPC